VAAGGWAADLTALTVTVDARGVARVVLDRPQVRNAFDAVLIDELTGAAERLGADPAVRVVVLSGAGESFSAGGDMRWMLAAAQLDEAANVADAVRFDGVFRALYDLPKALIGRVHGHALAGGTGLVAVCDVAIADRGARLGLTEVRVGLAPAVVAPYVVRKIGVSSARALFVTGEQVDADRALRMGLVHEVVDGAAALDAAVEAAVARVLRAGPQAVAVAKRTPDLALLPLDEATRLTPRLTAEVRTGPEAQEGLRAFLERRRPAWAPQDLP
jgi:methylglutaconyl-CoA hydratase